MTIIAKLNDKQEATLKRLKVLGYIINNECNNKPSQINFAIDLCEIFLNELTESEIIEIIKRNGE